MYVYVYIYIYTHISLSLCVYIYIYMYMYMCIYIYIYIYLYIIVKFPRTKGGTRFLDLGFFTLLHTVWQATGIMISSAMDEWGQH